MTAGLAAAMGLVATALSLGTFAVVEVTVGSEVDA